MSVRMVALVFESDLPSTERLVALALADYANDDGASIYPTVRKVMSKTGLCERSVRHAIASLKETGILIEEGERGTPHGPVKIYRLAISRGAAQAGVQEMHPPGAGDAPHGVQEMPDRGAGDAPRTKYLTQTRTQTGTTTLSRFAEFWNVFALKHDRPAAEEAWKKAIIDTDPEVIILGAEQYVRWLQEHPDPPKQKYAQGWLKGRRWEDTLEVPRTGNGVAARIMRQALALEEAGL